MQAVFTYKASVQRCITNALLVLHVPVIQRFTTTVCIYKFGGIHRCTLASANAARGRRGESEALLSEHSRDDTVSAALVIPDEALNGVIVYLHCNRQISAHEIVMVVLH